MSPWVSGTPLLSGLVHAGYRPIPGPPDPNPQGTSEGPTARRTGDSTRTTYGHAVSLSLRTLSATVGAHRVVGPELTNVLGRHVSLRTPAGAGDQSESGLVSGSERASEEDRTENRQTTSNTSLVSVVHCLPTTVQDSTVAPGPPLRSPRLWSK